MIDIGGGLAGFYTPGLGRSTTADWTIEGNHFADRLTIPGDSGALLTTSYTRS